MAGSQQIISGRGCIGEIPKILKRLRINKYLLVCDSGFGFIEGHEVFEQAEIPYRKFDSFTSNPLYSDVCNGVNIFNSEGCEAIVAVGGGSAIDVAKCIKLFCRLKKNTDFLLQTYFENDVALIAAPTTAGTGSESTRFAVIYKNGMKQSVHDYSIIPNYAVLDANALKSLPIYQKKCTLLDALCQGIESWWSVNSNKESKHYSKIAVETILKYAHAYLFENSLESAENIMVAANHAGRAINITQTTAPHAMSYKISSLCHIPHGHAVAICLPAVWEFMMNHMELCLDVRGKDYLHDTFLDIGKVFRVQTVEDAIRSFKDFLVKLSISSPSIEKKEDLALLAQSVNPIRLSNNPVKLDERTLYELYVKIFSPKYLEEL